MTGTSAAPTACAGPRPGSGSRLTAAGFRACTEQGGRLDGHQVIDLALDAITRAAARA